MKVFRFIEPYFPNGRTRFRSTVGKTGVYLIKENDRLVYIGFSAKNLYKTLYRHFEQWNHKGQPVITYADRMLRNRYTVRVVLCTSGQAVRLEKALILKHRPRDNENKYLDYELNFQDRQVVEVYQETEIAPF